jgi:hypothetical protein
MFLGAKDIEVLTGRKRRQHQISWLSDHGYPFEVNAAGVPVVLRSVVERKLGGKVITRNRARPRFERLKSGT